MKFTKFALAAALFASAATAMANDCAVEIEGNDAMLFNKSEIAISKQCKEFTITLKHVGTLPKVAMGHNVVVSKTADAQDIATLSAAAGADADYVDASDARVVGHTALIGGGETTSVTLDVSKFNFDEAYTYFCSFPGHFAMMKGDIKFVD